MDRQEYNRNWKDKEARALKAKDHVTLIESKYKNEIEHSILNSKIYEKDHIFNTPKKPCYPKPEMKVVDKDTVTALFEESLNENKIAVLNFASFKNAGGRFLDGSAAQEEALCHESTLYPVLKSFENKYYIPNHFQLNRALYLNRAIYSKDVVFMRNGVETKADVITCAAPNFSAAHRYQKISRELNHKYLESRIAFLLKMADEEKAETLILGAWGCGVFGQDPYEVASLFKKELESGCYNFKKVIFAVPSGSRNNLAFVQTIGE